MKVLLRVGVFCFVTALLVSCGPKPGRDVATVIAEEQQLASGGRVDKALSHLERYYKSTAYNHARLPFLAALIQIELGAGRVDAAKARFLAAASDSPALAQQYLSALIQAREWPVADALLSKVEAELGKSPAWQTAAANDRVDLILGRDGYKGAMTHLARVMTVIPDEAAARSVTIISMAAKAAGDPAAAEAFSESALSMAPARVKTREAGANAWMTMAAKRGSVDEIITRLEHLQGASLAPSFIINQISDLYAPLLGKGHADTFKRLFAVCEKVGAGELSGNDRALLGGMMLDISYYLEDFEMSLKLIESGVVDIQGDQKLQMIAKVHAHIAMKKGRPLEAVKYLREFMGYIAKQDRMELDPVNNCRISREMILGLNAKRIGDLLTSAGDVDGAKHAYGEARQYYGMALKTFPDPKSAEYQKIVKDAGAIPH